MKNTLTTPILEAIPPTSKAPLVSFSIFHKDLMKSWVLLCCVLVLFYFIMQGLTVFSPIHKYFKAGAKIGIIGCGGLGHLAIQFAAKMGAEVTAFSSAPEKSEWLKQLGANFIVNSTDLQSLAKEFQKYDLVLSTMPAY